jgi:hypothetical protein
LIIDDVAFATPKDNFVFPRVNPELALSWNKLSLPSCVNTSIASFKEERSVKGPAGAEALVPWAELTRQHCIPVYLTW